MDGEDGFGSSDGNNVNRSILLTIDGIINLVLGVLLVTFPASLVEVLGVPDAPPFCPNILGGILIGIGIAFELIHTGVCADNIPSQQVCRNCGLEVSGMYFLGVANPPVLEREAFTR